MTAAPVSCAYPLNVSEATLQGFGYTGRLALSAGDQTGDYVIVGGLAGVNEYAAAASPGTTLDASTGDKVLRWRFDAMPTVTAESARGTLKLYNAALNQVLYELNHLASASGYLLAVIDGSLNTVYIDPDVSLTPAGHIDLRFDATAGVMTIYRDGVALTLSNGGAYSQQALFPVLEAAEQPGVTTAPGAGHITQSLLTSAADISGAHLSGATDFCGNAIGSAALPVGAQAGDVYEVSVAGSYGGVAFSVSDLAVVRSDGTSVTRIPALAPGVADVSGLQSALDLKLDAAEYHKYWKGSYASLAALEAAHPLGSCIAGDYANVDAGTGSPLVRYNYDPEDGWVQGGGVVAATTSEVVEGGNLYFTAARVRDTVLTGLSLATSAVISATDTVLTALGKLQAQISAKQDIIQSVTWAELQAISAAANSGKRYFVSDVGTAGSDWISNGVDWYPISGHVLLAKSGEAVTIGATSGAEVAAATITIPGGLMGANGQLRISTLWTASAANTNSKVGRLRLGGLGGTLFASYTLTSFVTLEGMPAIIRNANSAASQKGRVATVNNYSGSTSSMPTSSIDTTTTQTLVISATVVSDSVTLESYTVELLR